MAYLNLDLDYFDHPKTKRLVGLLGRGSDVLPVRLWCYCGKYHAETGSMTGYSPTDLESLIGWWGQPGKAVEALVRLGFLETAGAGFQVHDWEKINAHIAALKARATAAALARWAKEREDAQALLKHSSSNAGGNALTVLPSIQEENTSGLSPGGDAGAKPKGKKPKPVFPPDSDPMRLAAFFAKFHADWAKGAKPADAPTLQRWAGIFDLMLRVDGHSVDAIGAMLNAIDLEKPPRSGDFLWRKVILSPDTLRKRWNEGKLGKFLEVPEYAR